MEKSIDELKGLVGTSHKTVDEFRIEAGKVEEFGRAIGVDGTKYDVDDWSRDESNTIPVPLTFTRTAVFPRYRPSNFSDTQDAALGFDLGFENEYRVHGEHEFKFERPIFVGDLLVGETTLTNVYQQSNSDGNLLTFAVLDTEYKNDQGDNVLTETATFIENPSGLRNIISTDGERHAVGKPRSVERVTNVEEINVNDKGPKIVKEFDRRDFVRYAGASGGLDRIHYDDTYVQSAGYDTVFGQGMLVAGHASRVLSQWFGVEPVKHFQTRFTAPIWPEDKIAIWGEVTSINSNVVDVELKSNNQRGETVLEGTASVTL